MKNAQLTPQRLKGLFSALKSYPELGYRRLEDLEKLVSLELGSLQALDSWIPYGSIETRAVAPKFLYLVCAHNLAISAWQGLLRGLILGSQIQVKTSSSQKKAIQQFINRLPAALRKLIKISAVHSESAMRQAEAVIAFGTDETIEQIYRSLSPQQRFLAYGHQVSLLWLGKVERVTPDLLERVAEDFCTFDQLGCLSPQAIYLEKGSQTLSFIQQLAKALERRPIGHRARIEQFRAAALIREIREHSEAERTFVPLDKSTAWTIIWPRRPEFQSSCGYRTIFVHEVKSAQLSQALAQVKGKISTLGIWGSLESELEEIFLELGVKRFCPVGQSQSPSPLWHHDGRPQLGDLVRWVDRETIPIPLTKVGTTSKNIQ